MTIKVSQILISHCRKNYLLQGLLYYSPRFNSTLFYICSRILALVQVWNTNYRTTSGLTSTHGPRNSILRHPLHTINTRKIKTTLTQGEPCHEGTTLLFKVHTLQYFIFMLASIFFRAILRAYVHIKLVYLEEKN